MVYKVRTSVDDKEKAELIAKALVNTHAAVTCHIQEVTSIYAWEKRVDTLIEYEINAICTNLENAKKVIDAYHHYALPEFIYEEVKCSKEIKDWCMNWCKDFKKISKTIDD